MFTCYFTMKLTYYDQITICLHSPPLGIFNLMRLVQVECAFDYVEEVIMSAHRATFIAKKVFLRSIREKQLASNKFIDGDCYDLVMIEHCG